jgi:uncharacterized protein (TIGR02145 family)
MQNKFLIIICFFVYIVLFEFGCNKSEGIFKDKRDGKVYKYVIIESQVWMAENLNSEVYRNGDPIPNISDNKIWCNYIKVACCSYDNDYKNAATYGMLYNWYAVNDNRGLCPEGWHIPSNSEWELLINHLGGDGGKMKTIGNIETENGLWLYPNEGATNDSGFSGLPGGCRGINGSFINLGNNAYWWSSGQTSLINAWCCSLGKNNSLIDRSNNIKTYGLNVRCIKN